MAKGSGGGSSGGAGGRAPAGSSRSSITSNAIESKLTSLNSRIDKMIATSNPYTGSKNPVTRANAYRAVSVLKQQHAEWKAKQKAQNYNERTRK